MRALLSRVLILITIIGVVIAPPLWTGFAELRLAQNAEKSVQQSRHYAKAARLLPWRPELWEKAGIAMYVSGNQKDAIPYFEKARKSGVLSGFGWDLLGSGYWQTGDHQTALRTWENGLAEHPSYFEFYSRLGEAYRELGNIAAEQNAIERWLVHEDEARAYLDALGTTSAPFHYRLGQLLSLSEPDRALGEFLQAASLDPQYDPAAESMRTVLNLASLETDDSRRLVIIGRGLGILQEWTLAAEAFRQAIASDRSNAEAWAWLGEAEGQLGGDGKAELDEAASLEPANPIVHSLRGLYWMRQDQPEQALHEYQRAAGLEPDNPAWRVSIGEAYSLSGDLQAALQSYLEAIEMAPSQASYLRLLADFCAHYDVQVEEYGLPAAQAALELSPDDPLVQDTLGWTLVKLERYSEAQDALEHALSLEPELALPHLHLGMLALYQDDWEAARDHLRQALELDPDGPVGEQAKGLLDQYFP